MHTPGLKVVCPATAYDAKGLLKSAIRDNNPVLFFEHKLLYRRIKEDLPEEEYTVPLGKAVVRRPGRDLTIVTYAAMVHASLEAAEQLAEEGIEAEVSGPAHAAAARSRDDPRIGAQDEQAAGGARRHAHRRHRRRDCGAGERVGLRRSGRADPPRHSLDTPVPFSPPLEEHFLPNAERIAAAARDLAQY